MHFDPLSAGMLFDFGADLSEKSSGAFEQLMDFLFALLVPFLIGDPAAKWIGKMNFVFPCNHPVRQERKLAFQDALKRVLDGAAGIDSPNNTLLLAELADDFKERNGNWRGLRRIMKGAVEVE